MTQRTRQQLHRTLRIITSFEAFSKCHTYSLDGKRNERKNELRSNITNVYRLLTHLD